MRADSATELDIAAAMVKVRHAAERRPPDTVFLLGALLDDSPVVSSAAARRLLAAVPMAALPERWDDPRPARAVAADAIPGWLSDRCAGWGESGDFVDECVALLAERKNDGARLVELLSVFQGAHRLLPRRLREAGLSEQACRSARAAVSARNRQYPRQICFSPTYACQLKCSYCISAGLEVDSTNTASIGDTRKLLDWAADNDVVRVCLSGGEPTMYPHFVELLTYARELGLEVILATNGLGEPETTDAVIESAMPSVTLHLTEELAASPDLTQFKSTGRRLMDAGLNVAVRYNFTHPGDEPARCLDLAAELGVVDVRVAVPIPNTDRKNAFISPAALRPFGELLGRCVDMAMRGGIHVSLAKPFPPCMLPESAADNFLSDGSMLSNCQVCMQGFSHNIVVHPDLRFSPCLALNRKSESSILEYRGVRQAGGTYRGNVSALMRQPFLEACTSCPLYIGGRCLGGCLSYRL